MTMTVEAVVEGGGLRLLEPLDLPEGQRVRVTVDSEDAQRPASSQGPDPRKAAEILAAIAALPMEPDDEEFSGTDHDRILYGEKGAR